MIGCDNRCFSELGKIKVRTKWFERRQTKDLNDRSAKVAFSLTRVINKRAGIRRKLFGQERISKRRESCCGRALASDRISAKNAWPRARHRLRQFRRPAEGAFVAGPADTRFPAHLLPQEGQPRSLAKARSSRKESFGNFNSFQRSTENRT